MSYVILILLMYTISNVKIVFLLYFKSKKTLRQGIYFVQNLLKINILCSGIRKTCEVSKTSQVWCFFSV